MSLRLIRHPDLRLTRLDDEGVALHLGERKYFTLNETGAIVIEALEQPATVDDLVRRLVEEFDTTEAAARDSVEAFLTTCREARLVVPADQVGGA